MADKTYQAIFKFQGRDYPLSISKHFPYQDGFCWMVLVANYYAGDIVKGTDGVWYNLGDKPNHKNLPFPLTHKHYQRLGAIIERELL